MLMFIHVYVYLCLRLFMFMFMFIYVYVHSCLFFYVYFIHVYFVLTGRRRSISRRSLTTKGGASDGQCRPNGSRPRSLERGIGPPGSGTAVAPTTRVSRPPRAIGRLDFVGIHTIYI